MDSFVLTMPLLRKHFQPMFHTCRKRRVKNVLFHDESAYNTAEDTPILGKLPIKPKGRGSSIMVSEFIEEQDGYLALSDQQYEFEVSRNKRQDIGKLALKI